MSTVPSSGRDRVRTAVTLARCAVDLLRHYPREIAGIVVTGRFGPLQQQIRRALERSMSLHRMPADATREVLEGGVDRHLTLLEGRLTHFPGLLSRHADGALMIPVFGHLSPALSRDLSRALDHTPATDLPRILVFDESYDDAPGAADSALADRLPIHLFAPVICQQDLSAFEIESPTASNRTHDATAIPAAGQAPLPVEQMARVRIDERQMRDVANICLQLGIDSCRAACQCLHLARLQAARWGRLTVTDADLAVAMQLSLAPRARCLPEASEPQEACHDEAVPPRDSDRPVIESDEVDADSADTPDRATGEDDDSEGVPETANIDDPAGFGESPESESRKPSQPGDPEAGSAGLDDGADQTRVIDSVLACLPPHLLREHRLRQRITLRRGASAASGRSALKRAGGQRGPIVGTVRDRRAAAGNRIHLTETIKAAIALQRLRQPGEQHPADHGTRQPGLIIRPEDIRFTRHQHSIRTTTIFAVDASGSTAMQRLAEAKGAIELLLADCYVRRDQVALITFRGTTATLDLPPTRSLTRARRTLKDLPGGGGTPMAAGIALSADMVRQLQQAGEQAVVIFMTDARANITLDGKACRLQATIDAEQQAARLSRSGVRVLFIDSAPRPSARAQRLAAQLQAEYLALPRTDLRTLPAQLRLQA